MCGSMVDIQSVAAEIRREKKIDRKIDRMKIEITGQKYNGPPQLHRAAITRMWANAQRYGHPAEYRWRRLFNAVSLADAHYYSADVQHAKPLEICRGAPNSRTDLSR